MRHFLTTVTLIQFFAATTLGGYLCRLCVVEASAAECETPESSTCPGLRSAALQTCAASCGKSVSPPPAASCATDIDRPADSSCRYVDLGWDFLTDFGDASRQPDHTPSNIPTILRINQLPRPDSGGSSYPLYSHIIRDILSTTVIRC